MYYNNYMYFSKKIAKKINVHFESNVNVQKTKIDKSKFEVKTRVMFLWKKEIVEQIEVLKKTRRFHSRSCHDIHRYANTKV